MRTAKNLKNRIRIVGFIATVCACSACVDESTNLNQPTFASPSPTAKANVSPLANSANQSPTANAQQTPTATPPPTPLLNETSSGNSVPGDALMIPVVGVKKSDLLNTFTASRSEGRSHDAIDIIAKKGTPVVATADGEIARFFDSDKGGITIYQRSADKKLMYYYAHLDRRADGIQPGQFVKRGTVIGYVGDTGNSGAGNYHLHFAIWTIDDPKRDWDGTNIDPYPLLVNGIENNPL